ncbi:hypothetical protein [Streptomyces atriruber]|uniref:hypothetical protein n=1 Tax=Streptomyces atriruber TaxID=545121 RepID=UPI0006E12595|nr:hypothetical protein [Streptomyces atriruber]
MQFIPLELGPINPRAEELVLAAALFGAFWLLLARSLPRVERALVPTEPPPPGSLRASPTLLLSEAHARGPGQDDGQPVTGQARGEAERAEAEAELRRQISEWASEVAGRIAADPLTGPPAGPGAAPGTDPGADPTGSGR